MSAVASKSNRPIGHILRGLSWADYRALPDLNFSTLKLLNKSAKQFKHGGAKENDNMRLGEAAHCAVLEPAKFASTFAVWRERDADGDSKARRGNAWDKLVAANPERTIITEDQETEALCYQLAVSSDREAMKYLALGDPEVTLRWQLGARMFKGRVDWLTDLDNGPVLVGLKTCADIGGNFFERQATRMLYGMQWALYADGYEAITGIRPSEVVEIVVEKQAPYDVVVYEIGNEELAIGRKQYLELLAKLDECEQTQKWPGVGGGEKKRFFFPAYVYSEYEEEMYI